MVDSTGATIRNFDDTADLIVAIRGGMLETSSETVWSGGDQIAWYKTSSAADFTAMPVYDTTNDLIMQRFFSWGGLVLIQI